MTEAQDPNLPHIRKIRELFIIYQEIDKQLAAPQKKMKEQMEEIRRLLDSGSVENLKHYLNDLNNTQTKLVNRVKELNIAYTKLRNAVK